MVWKIGMMVYWAANQKKLQHVKSLLIVTTINYFEKKLSELVLIPWEVVSL
jgi:hypothetical protein